MPSFCYTWFRTSRIGICVDETNNTQYVQLECGQVKERRSWWREVEKWRKGKQRLTRRQLLLHCRGIVSAACIDFVSFGQDGCDQEENASDEGGTFKKVFGHLWLIPGVCQFWSTTALFWPVKSTQIRDKIAKISKAQFCFLIDAKEYTGLKKVHHRRCWRWWLILSIFCLCWSNLVDAVEM